jgi:hypothetical protein
MLDRRKILKNQLSSLLEEKSQGLYAVYPWIILSEMEEGHCDACSVPLYLGDMIFVELYQPTNAWCVHCLREMPETFKILIVPPEEEEQLTLNELRRLYISVETFLNPIPTSMT